MIRSAETAEITQPTPRNIGRRKTHNTNPMIEVIRIATHLTTFFMRLRLEMDALPRLSDMLLFVFIVRHFFYASIDYRSFACSLNDLRVRHKRDVRPRWKKYKLTAGRSGDFFCRREKNIPAGHVQRTEQAITSIVDGTAINWSEDPAPVKTDINILVRNILK